MITEDIQKTISKLKDDPVARNQAADEFWVHPDYYKVMHQLNHKHPNMRRIGETFFDVTMDSIYQSIAIEIEATDILDGQS